VPRERTGQGLGHCTAGIAPARLGDSVARPTRTQKAQAPREAHKAPPVLVRAGRAWATIERPVPRPFSPLQPAPNLHCNLRKCISAQYK
jgi:hypothetical protein